MQKIRYGFIGCGMMGQEHLRNIALLSDTEVTRIYEPDPHMATDSFWYRNKSAACKGSKKSCCLMTLIA
jgi:predicted dehydrogenase